MACGIKCNRRAIFLIRAYFLFQSCSSKNILETMGMCAFTAARGSYDDLCEPIIFLDVDGVLNSVETRLEKSTGAGWDRPYPTLLDNLQNVVEESKAKVVVSSTWRLEPDKMEELMAFLTARNIHVLGQTGDFSCGRGDRVDEIFDWLSSNRHNTQVSWVTIDDLNLLAMNPKLTEEHMVRTSDSTGLTAVLAQEAIDKLLAQSEKLWPAAEKAP